MFCQTVRQLFRRALRTNPRNLEHRDMEHKQSYPGTTRQSPGLPRRLAGKEPRKEPRKEPCCES